MSASDVRHSLSLLTSVTAHLAATDIDVSVHGVSEETIASLLMAGAQIDRLGDGTHVAELRQGRVRLLAFGKPPAARNPLHQPEENNAHE